MMVGQAFSEIRLNRLRPGCHLPLWRGIKDFGNKTRMDPFIGPNSERKSGFLSSAAGKMARRE